VASSSSVERVSALAAHYAPEANADASVTLTEIRNLVLWQLAVWPDTIDSAGNAVASKLGVNSFPTFCASVTSGDVSMLRIEPCKFWVLGAALSEPDASDGAVLDLSHSRTHIRISGTKASVVLNSYLPLDLREPAFPVGTVASTAFHHVGVTLWRTEHGYELFVPRGFAVSLWELLTEASQQYGLAIT